MGATGEWNLDQSRFARESLGPVQYLSKTYYEIWLAGLERLLAQLELAGPDEIAAAQSLRPPKPVQRTLAPAGVAALGGSTRREPPREAQFAVGDRVRARNMHPLTHTRLPRYVRGRVGTVESVHGCHVFPDTHARGGGEDPQWLYTVSFAGRELWGDDGDPATRVTVDAFEPYLEAAP